MDSDSGSPCGWGHSCQRQNNSKDSHYVRPNEPLGGEAFQKAMPHPSRKPPRPPKCPQKLLTGSSLSNTQSSIKAQHRRRNDFGSLAGSSAGTGKKSGLDSNAVNVLLALLLTVLLGILLLTQGSPARPAQEQGKQLAEHQLTSESKIQLSEQISASPLGRSRKMPRKIRSESQAISSRREALNVSQVPDDVREPSVAPGARRQQIARVVGYGHVTKAEAEPPSSLDVVNSSSGSDVAVGGGRAHDDQQGAAATKWGTGPVGPGGSGGGANNAKYVKLMARIPEEAGLETGDIGRFK